MNRRGFLSLLSGAVAGIALDKAIPFNRVWSFPKEIAIGDVFSMASINRPPLLHIGDIVRNADWPGLFVVTRFNSDDNVELYPCLSMRGVHTGKCSPIKCNPILIGETVPAEVSFASPRL